MTLCGKDLLKVLCTGGSPTRTGVFFCCYLPYFIVQYYQLFLFFSICFLPGNSCTIPNKIGSKKEKRLYVTACGISPHAYFLCPFWADKEVA